MRSFRGRLVGLAVLVALVGTALSASPAAAVTTFTKTCADLKDTSHPGAQLGTWRVKYTITSGSLWDSVQVTSLAFKSNAPNSQFVENTDPNWSMSWLDVTSTATGEAIRHPTTGESPAKGPSTIKATVLPVFTYPRISAPSTELLPLTPPNAQPSDSDYAKWLTPRCTIYLLPYTSITSSATRTSAWIGDSITDRNAGSLTARQGLATQWNALSPASKLEVDGWGGHAWSNRLDAIRGLSTTAPTSMVVELGGNDALWLMGNALAPTGSSTYVPDMQAKTQAAINEGLADAKATGRCLVLVTPPTYPAPELAGFGPNAQFWYQLYAGWIAGIIRSSASTSPVVKIADWDTLSFDQHDPGEWFDSMPIDNFHPNAAGRAAFVNLIKSTVATCP